MLPKGWHRSTLGEIAHVTSGGTPDRSNREYWGGSVPWVTTGEIQFNTITDTAEKITEAGLQNSSAKLLSPGTLLMAMYGQGKTRGQVAKLGIKAATNQACAAIQLKDGHDTDFYFQYLSSQYGELRELGNAGTQKNLNGGIIKGVDVPVPPFSEQRRIAKILSVWDEAIAKAERLLENSWQRRRGLARDLVLGQRRFPKFKAPWQQLSFRDVLKEVKRRVDWDDDQEYPLISVRRRSEGAFHRETLKGSEILTKKLNYAYEGEFLISKMQVVHGAMAVVPAELDGMFISDSYLAFQSADAEKFDINFIGWLSTTPQMYKAVRRCSYGVHIEKMTFDLDMFLSEKLYMPTELAEQQLICAVLASAQNEVKSATNHLWQLRQEKAALMSQLLTGKRRVKLTEAETEAPA